MKIPYQFSLWGEPWRVVWGWKGKQPWRGYRWTQKNQHLMGLCVFEPRNGWRLIILHPALKRRSQIERARVFVHELQHAMAWEAKYRRVEGWRGRDLSHSVIDRMEMPLAAFFVENIGSWLDSLPRKPSASSRS